MTDRFRALRTFSATETSSDYVAGLLYTVRDGDHLLRSLLDGWIADGRIEMVSSTAATVSGRD